MSFLSIKQVRLDSKECIQVKLPQPNDPEESAEISRSADEKIKEEYGKENAETQGKHKAGIGEKIWRPPRKGESNRLKSLMMSPVATNSMEPSSFPKLIAIEKENRKMNKIENGILTIKRSSSAPGCTYRQARVTKHKFRLPCIPDLQTLSITEDQPIKTLVVEGKKLGSTGGTVSTQEFSDNSYDLPRSEIKVIIEDRSDVQAKKVGKERVVDEIGSVKVGRFHGDGSYEDSFPSIKKTEFRVKSAYTNSSKKFNTYLQSRFGKSVYESADKKTGTDVGEKYVYWAPVLINKKILYSRTVDANGTLEGGEERHYVKDCDKKGKIHSGVSIYANGDYL